MLLFVTFMTFISKIFIFAKFLGLGVVGEGGGSTSTIPSLDYAYICSMQNVKILQD